MKLKQKSNEHRFTKEKPIYINLVRDPVMRIRSEFHARRADRELTKMEIMRRNNESPGSGRSFSGILLCFFLFRT